MTHNVRTHARRTRTGGTTQVRQHNRKGGLGPNPGHAWKTGKKGFSHVRKGRKGLGAAVVTFALLEIVLYVLLQTSGLVAGIAGALLLGFAYIVVRRREGWQ